MAYRKLRQLHVEADDARMNIINSIKASRSKRKKREEETGNVSLNGPRPLVNGVPLDELENLPPQEDDETIDVSADIHPSEEMIGISEYNRVTSLLSGYENVIAKFEDEQAKLSAFYESRLDELLNGDISSDSRMLTLSSRYDEAVKKEKDLKKEIEILKASEQSLNVRLSEAKFDLDIANSKISNLETQNQLLRNEIETLKAEKSSSQQSPAKPITAGKPKPQAQQPSVKRNQPPMMQSRPVKSYPFGGPPRKGGVNGYSGWN